MIERFSFGRNSDPLLMGIVKHNHYLARYLCFLLCSPTSVTHEFIMTVNP